MKKFKVSLAVIAALACGAIVISAYTKPVENKRFADTWFVFNGSVGQEYDYTQYSALGSAPTNPTGGTKVDAIFVVSAEIYPFGHPKAGKPMVDDNDAGGNTIRIDEAIAHVLANPSADGASLSGNPPAAGNDLVYLKP